MASPRGTPSYLAFVLRAGEREPRIVPLGPAAGTDRLVREWAVAIAAGRRAVPVPGGAAESQYREAAGRLRRAIWDPAAREMGAASMALVVPDGSLHLVSFATLPGEDGRYLAEAGPVIHYLSAERDVAAGAATSPAGAEILALGDPDFDLAPPGTQARAASRPGAPAAYRGATAGCAEFRSLRFEPLPQAREEARAVASLWSGAGAGPAGGDVLLVGADASETAVKRLAPGRRVLHLATHGFFAQDRCASALDLPEGTPAAPAGSSGAGDNPLLLSGLALAGANRRDDARREGDLDDGILTAEEIASLDLAGVDWVVLSACETGLGEVRVGEGVLGLRRAFQVAGARTLILTLWKVQDAAARSWMEGLYRARLAGASTAEAARRASAELIAARRSEGRSTHPFFWGAFVAAGDWR